MAGPTEENSFREYDSLWQLFADCTEHFRDEPLFVSRNETVSYKEFRARTLGLSERFRNITQNKIIISAADPLFFAECFFAAVFSGHIACLLSPECSVPEFFEDAYIVNDGIRPPAGPAIDSEDFRPAQCLPDEPCLIVFSSGTTGRADGIMLSQRNILRNLRAILEVYHHGRGERLLHILPYWHMFGLTGDLLMPLCGGSVICLPDSEAGILPAMRRFRPEIINMPPAMAEMLCELFEREGNTDAAGGCLKRVMCGGAPLSTGTFDRLLKFGIKPLTAYGMTECSPCVSAMPEDTLRRGSAGKLLSCWKIGFSKDNEILLSGDCVMLGYYHNAGESEKRIRDGWFHTGDIGRIDAEGFITVTGRMSSLLVFSNGVKCLPERLEEKIGSLPGVRECMITKIPDAAGDHPGLIICAEKISEETNDAIRSIMKEAHLFPFELRSESAKLPRNRMGKLIREENN